MCTELLLAIVTSKQHLLPAYENVKAKVRCRYNKKRWSSCQLEPCSTSRQILHCRAVQSRSVDIRILALAQVFYTPESRGVSILVSLGQILYALESRSISVLVSLVYTSATRGVFVLVALAIGPFE